MMSRSRARVRAESQQHQVWILSLLRERGPLLTNEIAAELNRSLAFISRMLQILMAEGRVISSVLYRKQWGDYRSEWRAVDETRIPLHRDDLRAEPKRGITADDVAWMRYWRERRQARQQKNRQAARS